MSKKRKKVEFSCFYTDPTCNCFALSCTRIVKLYCDFFFFFIGRSVFRDYRHLRGCGNVSVGHVERAVVRLAESRGTAADFGSPAR